ncbi:hypothetical protein JB92DRAFT_3107411 [Gautieria morchelliformis]|nr:hypothetical protein JB92DRAFT_3107411 [Gautieria morchelliformis]
MHSKPKIHASGGADHLKRKDRQHFHEASAWHETGGPLNEETSETQWFEQSVGGTGRVPSPKKRGRVGARAVRMRVKPEPALEGLVVGAAAGSGTGVGEVELDGSEESSMDNETMPTGWSQREPSAGPVEGCPSPQSLPRVQIVTDMPMEMGDLPRARGLGRQETARAIDHPMASVTASTDEVDKYLEWLRKRASLGPVQDGGAPDEMWELLQRQHRVAVHLAREHSMRDRRWVMELSGVSNELGTAMELLAVNE